MMSSESFQAGGHPDIVKVDPDEPTRLLKRACQREIEFYEHLADRLDSIHHRDEVWKGWRADYFGRTRDDGSSSEEVIILKNLVPTSVNLPDHFVHPNVLDIKLGQRLYDDDAPEEKVIRMTRAANESTSARFGIRLTGGKVWNNETGAYETIPKSFGKSLDPQGSDLSRAFSHFFPISSMDADVDRSSSNDQRLKDLKLSPGGIPIKLMRSLLEEIMIPQFEKLSSYVSKFEWRIYGSSLLIVYEGDLHTLTQKLGDSHHRSSLSMIKMIDFAHAYEAQGHDEGLITGLKTTSGLLTGLLDTISSFEEPSPK